MPQFAPGGTGLPLVGHLPFMLREPMHFLAELSRRYGDVAAFRLGTRAAVLVRSTRSAAGAATSTSAQAVQTAEVS